MPNVPINQVSRGQAVNMDGQIMVIVKMEHVKPGKGPAYQQTKLKNIETGKIIEKRIRAADTVDVVHVDRQDYSFSYRNGDTYVFLNTDTYEEMEVPATTLGDDCSYLLEGVEVSIMFAQGRIISVELPAAVALTVTACDPGVKNATATNVFKNATLETGLQVQVPAFINQGDKLKIDTATAAYIERVAIG